MSRIGKKPIEVPASVKVALDRASRSITIEGPKGKLSYVYRPEVSVAWEPSEKRIVCTIAPEQMEDRQHRAYWGTVRARIRNMIVGVTNGYEKRLEVVGVGWNAKPQGRSLVLSVGYANAPSLPAPMGVDVKVEGPIVIITGPDKQAVGQYAAEIRAARPPEPYNGKGIKYVGEHIIRKQGKVFGS
jgi:large subunit ribosomal protein L6